MAHRLPLADIQFISEFAAFCRTKGDEGYVYESNVDCACAQYLRATEQARRPFVGGIGYAVWFDEGEPSRESHSFPIGLAEALATRPFTFSALADRLEALIADAPSVRS